MTYRALGPGFQRGTRGSSLELRKLDCYKLNSTSYYKYHKLGSNGLQSKDGQMVPHIQTGQNNIQCTWNQAHVSQLSTDAGKKIDFDKIQHALNIKPYRY